MSARISPTQLRISQRAIAVLEADVTHAIVMLELCASTIDKRAPERADLARQAAKRLRASKEASSEETPSPAPSLPPGPVEQPYACPYGCDCPSCGGWSE